MTMPSSGPILPAAVPAAKKLFGDDGPLPEEETDRPGRDSDGTPVGAADADADAEASRQDD